MAKRKTEKGPVQFNSLRRLLKDKQVRLGEFDRLADQRRRERMERNKRRLLTPSRRPLAERCDLLLLSQIYVAL